MILMIRLKQQSRLHKTSSIMLAMTSIMKLIYGVHHGRRTCGVLSRLFFSLSNDLSLFLIYHYHNFCLVHFLSVKKLTNLRMKMNKNKWTTARAIVSSIS